MMQIGLPGQGGMHKTVVGIDLGTTNSLVAAIVDGEPQVLARKSDGNSTVPSAVYYGADGSIQVGSSALKQQVTHPQDTVVSVKRFMGRGANDPEVQAEQAMYKKGEGSDAVVRLSLQGQTRTPVEISAEILKTLKAQAEETLGRRVKEAVITVPAYFDDAQRQATKDAGRIAGIKVLRLLNEPTAAALAYGLNEGQDGTYAVYDLGGGTFDISILYIEAGLFEVRSTGGNTHLGGDDLDHAIANHFLRETGAGKWSDLAPSPRRYFLAEARAAKERLTDSINTEVKLSTGSEEKTFSFSRQTLETLIRPIIEKTGEPCRKALADADLTQEELDGVILVGGATRVPYVRAFVESLFGRAPYTGLDPDKVVALGAAVQAGVLSGWKKNILLLDVIPLSLGLETMGGVVEKLIHRNATMPASASQEFTTFADGQTGMDIHVLQGERELVEDNRSLARFSLTGIPPLPAGLAKVKVTFQVDADGLLKVSAQEEHTGVEQSVQIKPSYGLTDCEVESMLKAALDNAESDVNERLLRDARVEADRILAAEEKQLKTHKDLLLEGELRIISAQMAKVRAASEGDEHQAINIAVEELDEISKHFAQRVMEFSISSALTGQSISEAENSMSS